jgi:putative endonuclease
LLSTTAKGREGERRARELLEGKGHLIIETNWRFRKFEIDIISKQGDTVVFTEVKLRGTGDFGEPLLSVGRRKQRRLVEAANFYLLDRDIGLEARFDVISIVGDRISHIEDAFYPLAGR